MTLAGTRIKCIDILCAGHSIFQINDLCSGEIELNLDVVPFKIFLPLRQREYLMGSIDLKYGN